MAACSHVFLGWLGGVSATPFIAALAAIVAGILSTLPDRWLPRWADVLIVAALGAVVGLIPDGQALSDGAIQSILGTILGIAILPALIWAALEGVARRVSQIVPAVAGSWVAAVGILIATISS